MTDHDGPRQVVVDRLAISNHSGRKNHLRKDGASHLPSAPSEWLDFIYLVELLHGSQELAKPVAHPASPNILVI